VAERTDGGVDDGGGGAGGKVRGTGGRGRRGPLEAVDWAVPGVARGVEEVEEEEVEVGIG